MHTHFNELLAPLIGGKVSRCSLGFSILGIDFVLPDGRDACLFLETCFRIKNHDDFVDYGFIGDNVAESFCASIHENILESALVLEDKSLVLRFSNGIDLHAYFSGNAEIEEVWSMFLPVGTCIFSVSLDE